MSKDININTSFIGSIFSVEASRSLKAVDTLSRFPAAIEAIPLKSLNSTPSLTSKSAIGSPLSTISHNLSAVIPSSCDKTETSNPAILSLNC